MPLFQQSCEFFDKNGFAKFDSPILSVKCCRRFCYELRNRLLWNTSLFESIRSVWKQVLWPLVASLTPNQYSKRLKFKTQAVTSDWVWVMTPAPPFGHTMNHLTCKQVDNKASSLRCFGPCPQALKHWSVIRRAFETPYCRLPTDHLWWRIDLARAWKRWKIRLRAFGTWRMTSVWPHETWISNHFMCQTFVGELPSSYQGLLTWNQFLKSRARALCVDSARSWRLVEKSSVALCVRKTTMPLLQKMDELGMDQSMNLPPRPRNTKPVPHGGFGIGIERMVTFVELTHPWSYSIPNVCCECIKP